MLKDAIRNNWATDISGYAQIIPATKDTDYPAWTVKILNSYGVAIPYDGEDDINESFANARRFLWRGMTRRYFIIFIHLV